MNEARTDRAKGYAVGKMLKGRNHPYPVVIDDFDGDREEFYKGMRMAGYFGTVAFA